MSDSNVKLGVVGTIFGIIAFIIVQFRLRRSQVRLAKATATADLLKVKNSEDRTTAALSRVDAAKDRITKRIADRDKKLRSLYEKIGSLNVGISDLNNRAASAGKRVGRTPTS